MVKKTRKPEKRGRKAADADAILDSACRVFSRKGYFRATVDDVIADAGIGKGTVYHHFRDKEGLLLAVLGRVAREVNRRVDLCLQGDPKLEEGLEAVAREILAFFAARPEPLRLFVREGALSIPAVRKTMGFVVRSMNGQIAELLGGPSTIRDAAVFNGMVFGLLRQKLGFANELIHPKKEAAFLAAFFLKGFRGMRR